MARLELVFVFALLFEGGNSKEELYRFSRPYEDVSLPCGTKREPLQCSRMTWLYNRDSTETVAEATRGKIKETSPRAARLSLGSDCSLVIERITAEDVGRYICRMDGTNLDFVDVYLNVLTVSQLPADSDQMRNNEVTLECSLLRYIGLPRCRSDGLRWVDETGTEVTEGVLKFPRAADCVAHLKHQSGDNRKFTCQFVQNNKVEIQADYTPDLTDPDPGSTPDPGSATDPGSTTGPGPSLDSAGIFIIVGVLVAVVFLLVVMAAVLIKHKRSKVTKDVQTPSQQKPDEPESDLTYVTVDHSKQKSFKRKAGNEEGVTYSTVKCSMRNGADDDHSNVYSYLK